MRGSVVHGESAALNGRGEGVFLEQHKNLAVTEVLCVYWNFRHRVGTSDIGSELPTSSISHGREGFIGNYKGPPKGGGSELPTLLFSAGRGPFVGRSKTLSMRLGTSDPGSELPTLGEIF